MAYRSTIRHDHDLHTVDIPNLEIPRCKHCGELVFCNATDDQIYAVFRAQIGLLTPEEMRSSRLKLGLSEREVARALHASEETVAKLEEGLRIQTRAQDQLLRVFFAVPEARAFLAGKPGAPSNLSPAVPIVPAPLQQAS
jgi:DNA-binding transcriptional regulator YiaG